MIPFSRDVFLGLVAQTNALLWPAQIALLLLGLAVLYLCLRPRESLERLPAIFLGSAWLSVGVICYGLQFTTLNWAAWLAATLFIAQGILLLWLGGLRNRLRLRFCRSASGWAGVTLLGAAIVAYPLLGLATGTGVEAIPVIAIDPGPTVLFTWGAFVLTRERTPYTLTVLPFIAAWVSASAGWRLGLPADLILMPAAISGIVLVIQRNGRLARADT